MEIRPEVSSFLTQTQRRGLTAARFQRFSSMRSLIRAITLLIHVARAYRYNKGPSESRGWHHCNLPHTLDELSQVRHVIIRAAQEEVFAQELTALELGQAVTKDSSLQKLRPVLEDDLICVSGRLKHADLSIQEKNPVILSKNSHTSLLLVRQYHEDVKHQGCHFTEGAYCFSPAEMCCVAEVTPKNRRTTYGRLTFRMFTHRPTLHLCWCRCVRNPGQLSPGVRKVDKPKASDGQCSSAA